MTHGKPYLTLGLLGRFEPDEVFLGFLDKLVHHYCAQGRGLCILLALLNRKHNRIAEGLMELKRTNEKLRLELAIDQIKKSQFEKDAKSVVAQDRNRLIEFADHVYFVDEFVPELVFMKMQFFFASHADIIMYASYAEMEYGFRKLEYQPVLPSLLLWNMKPSKRLHPNSDRWMFYHSIDFIRSRQFQVWSDEIPDDLLAAWIADDPIAIAEHAGRRSQEEDLLRLLDQHTNFLPLTVFLYGFSIYNELFSFGFSEYNIVRTRFIQFQTLLHSVADARQTGRTVDHFDLFDIGHYYGFVERIVSSKKFSNESRKF